MIVLTWSITPHQNHKHFAKAGCFLFRKSCYTQEKSIEGGLSTLGKGTVRYNTPMNSKNEKFKKVATATSMVAGAVTLVSLILLAIVMLNFNELLVGISYTLAYIVILLGLIALILTAFGIGIKTGGGDMTDVILQTKSGRLSLAVIIVSFLVITIARVEVHQYQIETGLTNVDGTVKVIN